MDESSEHSDDSSDSTASAARVDPITEFEQSFKDCFATLTNEQHFSRVGAEEIGMNVDQSMQRFLESGTRMKQFFSQKSLLLSEEKPEEVLKDNIDALKEELSHKEELLNQHSQNVEKWQKFLEYFPPVTDQPSINRIPQSFENMPHLSTSTDGPSQPSQNKPDTQGASAPGPSQPSHKKPDTQGASAAVSSQPSHKKPDTQGASAAVPSQPSHEKPDTQGASAAVPTQPSHEKPDTQGASAAVPTQPSHEKPDTQGASAAVPTQPSHEKPDTQGASAAVPTQPSHKKPDTQGASAAVPSQYLQKNPHMQGASAAVPTQPSQKKPDTQSASASVLSQYLQNKPHMQGASAAGPSHYLQNMPHMGGSSTAAPFYPVQSRAHMQGSTAVPFQHLQNIPCTQSQMHNMPYFPGPVGPHQVECLPHLPPPGLPYPGSLNTIQHQYLPMVRFPITPAPEMNQPQQYAVEEQQPVRSQTQQRCYYYSREA